MSNAGAGTVLRFERFELEPAEQILRVDGEPMPVGGRAFDLLLALASRPGQLVSKQELLDLVWPGLVVEEHNVATQIGNLRKLLGPGVITTVAGRGYRLTAGPAAAAAPQDTSPPRPPPHNLPAPRTRFIGREAALAGLARLLPSSRLLTLTGIGGCGKTRLALQFARQCLADFPDGVWFVDLAPLTDGRRVASVCAGVLGIREEGETPLLERLLAHLGPRRSLLLLDNCEHVVGAVAPLVDALLAGTAGTSLLVTSRETLGVTGEQVVPVRSLSLPLADDLASVLAAESARVFVDRARLARPEFEARPDDAAALAEICRRLDGIALALELAAARVTMMSLAEIAARLDDRFRLLTGGSRALPRHQTLRAAMQWSDEQLAPDEQRMLRQLAVFAGGWSLAAAAAVGARADAGPPPVASTPAGDAPGATRPGGRPDGDEYRTLALLTALHDKSLLVVDRLVTAGPPRYGMLETVRQYALERLEASGEAAAARDRHLAHFADLAEEAQRHWRGPAQQDWITRFRVEHENLVAALTWSCEPAADRARGLRLASATAFYWVWNGVELGHRLTHRVLESQDPAAAVSPAQVGALRSLANLSLFRGRYEDSLAHAQQAVAAARRLGEPRPLMTALEALAAALCTLGRVDEALQCQQEALDGARALGELSLQSSLLNGIAESLRSIGQLDAAERCYREALEIARARDDRLAVIVLLNNLIRVLVAADRPAEARDCAADCLPLVGREKVGIDLLEAAVGLASCRGEHLLAARWWGAADQRLREWGYRHQPVDVAHSARLIAATRDALGEPACAAAEAAGRRLDFDAAMAELAGWLGRSP